MSKAKFDAAKELINEKRYDEARALLKTIGHPTAREWEAKLDKIAPQTLPRPAIKEPKNNILRNILVLGVLGAALILLAQQIQSTQNLVNEAAVSAGQTVAPFIRGEVTAVVINPTQPEQEVILTTSPTDVPLATSTITDTPLPSITSTSTIIPTSTLTSSPIPTSVPMKFDSNSSGQQPVLGPLTFPSGIHKVVVQTDGFFIAQLETVSGECDAGFTGLFNLMAGQGKGGAGAILKSNKCVALIAISNVNDSWILEFQQITSSTPRINRLKFDDTTDGKQPVLGPIVIPSGTYRTRVVTNGFFIAAVETLSGTCDAGFTGLFNIMGGQANQGAETIFKSRDCEMLISISNVSEPWTPEFQTISQ